MALLEVRNLEVSFLTDDGVVRSVDGISYSVEGGRSLGIVGESGSGKSVSSLTLLGLTRAGNARFSGEVIFDGKDLLTMSEAELRKVRGEDIAMIFQDPLSSLHPFHRIGDQLAEAVRTHHDVSKGAAKDRAVEMLSLVGIPDPRGRLDSYPHEFSGGMRQRTMIAMALINSPKLIIADEPTTALDVTVQAQILELIGRLQQETGTAVILITHDLGVVARDDPRHRGHVRRAHRRARPDPRPVRLAPASLHLGPAALHPAPGRLARRAAHPHRGPPAVDDQPPLGLLVPPPLPVRPRGAQARGAHRSSPSTATRGTRSPACCRCRPGASCGSGWPPARRPTRRAPWSRWGRRRRERRPPPCRIASRPPRRATPWSR